MPFGGNQNGQKEQETKETESKESSKERLNDVVSSFFLFMTKTFRGANRTTRLIPLVDDNSENKGLVR